MENNHNLKTFLEIPYDRLEEMNLKALQKAEGDSRLLKKEYLAYLAKEKKIKAITVCFTDLEGGARACQFVGGGAARQPDGAPGARRAGGAR